MKKNFDHKIKDIVIYADGFMKSKKETVGGCSVAIFIDNQKVCHIKKYINRVSKKYRRIFEQMPETNNMFEYFALISALLLVKKYTKLYPAKYYNYYIYMDSEIVIKQINGLYSINSPHLEKLNKIANFVLEKIENSDNVKFNWIKRNKIVEILGH